MILYGDFWIPIIDAIKSNMNIDSKEYSVFEICRNKEEVLKAIKRFESKIAARDHSKKEKNEDSAFTE